MEEGDDEEELVEDLSSGADRAGGRPGFGSKDHEVGLRGNRWDSVGPDVARHHRESLDPIHETGRTVEAGARSATRAGAWPAPEAIAVAPPPPPPDRQARDPPPGADRRCARRQVAPISDRHRGRRPQGRRAARRPGRTGSSRATPSSNCPPRRLRAGRRGAVRVARLGEDSHPAASDREYLKVRRIIDPTKSAGASEPGQRVRADRQRHDRGDRRRADHRCRLRLRGDARLLRDPATGRRPIIRLDGPKLDTIKEQTALFVLDGKH